MSCRIMVLPSCDAARIKVLQIPEDMEMQEAYRSATGVIATVEESSSGHGWEDIEDALEEHGFQVVPFVLGPELS